MELRFLSAPDAARAWGILGKLVRHDIRNWALTGGFAFEIHNLTLPLDRSVRPLNDLDFITDAFVCIPETLSQDFLFRHVHPAAPPGKTMLQAIDRENALRADVFRAYGDTMKRNVRVDLAFGRMQVVSLEDLVARAARLLLDLAEGRPVASKHARDYLRFIESVSSERIEAAWQDHRKPMHPATFRETKGVLQDLILTSASLLIAPNYSQDPNQVCPQCAPRRSFQLADPKVVLSLLGYC
jgi:hypothetical protein